MPTDIVEHPLQDESTEARLRRVLDFVDGHVKFADTKNAALLAANVVATAGVLQVLTSSVNMNVWTARYLMLLGVTSLISAAVVLLSFLPVMQIPWLTRRQKLTDNDNLLFFGDIQKYTANAYLKAFAKASGLSPISVTELDRMHAEQIIANAKIAARKFTYFKVGIWITLIGALTPPIAIAVLIWVVTKQDWSS